MTMRVRLPSACRFNAVPAAHRASSPARSLTENTTFKQTPEHNNYTGKPKNLEPPRYRTKCILAIMPSPNRAAALEEKPARPVGAGEPPAKSPPLRLSPRQPHKADREKYPTRPFPVWQMSSPSVPLSAENMSLRSAVQPLLIDRGLVSATPGDTCEARTSDSRGLDQDTAKGGRGESKRVISGPPRATNQ